MTRPYVRSERMAARLAVRDARRAATMQAGRELKSQRLYGCGHSEHMEISKIPGVIAAFGDQRSSAKTRGIGFDLTLPEWWDAWKSSGKWSERGRGGYVMCRERDLGAYAVGNIYIATHQQNVQDCDRRRKRPARTFICAFPPTEMLNLPWSFN